jgi:hypothetical protein
MKNECGICEYKGDFANAPQTLCSFEARTLVAQAADTFSQDPTRRKSMPRFRQIFCLSLSLVMLCILGVAQQKQALLGAPAFVATGETVHNEAAPKQAAASFQSAQAPNHEATESDLSDAMWAVVVLKHSAHVLKAERLQVADTKTNGNGVWEFARSHALASMMQAGVNRYAFNLTLRSNSFFHQTMIDSANSNTNSLIYMFNRPTVHMKFVWGLRGSSANVIVPDAPTFEVHYNDVPGINPNDFQPAIVRLTVAPNSWRQVGEIHAKAGHSRDTTEFSPFVENRVAAQVTVLGKGEARIEAPKLPPGEYALVLRPVSGHAKITSADIRSDQGNWVALGEAWAFEVE